VLHCREERRRSRPARGDRNSMVVRRGGLVSGQLILSEIRHDVSSW
jgi:hypothetical protein